MIFMEMFCYSRLAEKQTRETEMRKENYQQDKASRKKCFVLETKIQKDLRHYLPARFYLKALSDFKG